MANGGTGGVVAGINKIKKTKPPNTRQEPSNRRQELPTQELA